MFCFDESNPPITGRVYKTADYKPPYGQYATILYAKNLKPQNIMNCGSVYFFYNDIWHCTKRKLDISGELIPDYWAVLEDIKNYWDGKEDMSPGAVLRGQYAQNVAPVMNQFFGLVEDRRKENPNGQTVCATFMDLHPLDLMQRWSNKPVG